MSETKIKASQIAKVSEIIERYKGFRSQLREFQIIHGGRGARLVYRNGLDDEYVFNHLGLETKKFLSDHFEGLEKQAAALRKEIEDAGFECDIW